MATYGYVEDDVEEDVPILLRNAIPAIQL